MNRGAVDSRNCETGTDAPCPAMTTKKAAQQAVVVLSICFFSGALCTAESDNSQLHPLLPSSLSFVPCNTTRRLL